MISIKESCYLMLNNMELFSLRQISMTNCGGTRGVMVIVVGNRLTQIQILNKAVCMTHNANTFEKGMNPNILPLTMRK